MPFIINLLIVILIITPHLSGEARVKYLKKDADIQFIGKRGGYDTIDVPQEIIEYEPTLELVENGILYTNRDIVTNECIADNHSNEYCPMNHTLCSGGNEYTSGTSKKKTKEASCTSKSPYSYYNSTKDKCVLPPQYANVCSDPESTYDRATDTCSGTGTYPAMKFNTPISVYYSKASQVNDEKTTNKFYNALKEAVIASGGSSVTRSDSFNNKGLLFSLDNPIPIYIKMYKRPAVPIAVNGKVYLRLINKYSKDTIQITSVTNDKEHYFFLYPPEGFQFSIGNPDTTKIVNTQAGDNFKISEFEAALWQVVKNAGGTTLNKRYVGPSTTGKLNGDTFDYIYTPNHTKDIFINYGNIQWSKPGIEDPTYIGCDTDFDRHCEQILPYIDANGYGDDARARTFPLPPSKEIRVAYHSYIGNGLQYKHYLEIQTDLPSGRTESVIYDDMNNNTYPLTIIAPGDKSIGTDRYCLNYIYDEKRSQYQCVDYDNCKEGWEKKENNGVPYCQSANSQPPQCSNPSFPTREYDECLGDRLAYTYYDYLCPDEEVNGANWTPVDPGGDCGESNLKYDDNGDGIKDRCNSATPPANNCARMHYTCPIDEVLPCVQRVGTGSTNTRKRPLFYSEISGNYKQLEYGEERNTTNTFNNRGELGTVEGKENQLCFYDKRNDGACFTFTNGCTFSGKMYDTTIHIDPQISIFNNPDEDIPQFHNGIREDHKSPTGISIAFDANDAKGYPLEQSLKNPPSSGKVTVEFYIKWNGNSSGNVFSFGDYQLRIDNSAIGFNNSSSSILGVSLGGYARKWTRISAIFNQGTLNGNKIYINGKNIPLSSYSTGTHSSSGSKSLSNSILIAGMQNGERSSYMGEFTGLNIYLDPLSDDQIFRNSAQGIPGGILYIEVQKHRLIGYDYKDVKLGEVLSSCELTGKIGFRPAPGTPEGSPLNPITSIVSHENRMEFWNSFELKGVSGNLEVKKSVPSQDLNDGYAHEFPYLEALYMKGFTGFRVFGNGATYAVSSNKMSLSTCQSLISGTPYFLAGRRDDDPLGNNAIDTMSRYMDGSFGEYCIIQYNEQRDNKISQFSLRTDDNPDGSPQLYCSPLVCEDHQCGTATCKEGFQGNQIKQEDRESVLNSTACISQQCDKNLDYFAVCGAKVDCPDIVGVYQTDDGRCVATTCTSPGLMNHETGKCEKLGCKDSIARGDGTCYKVY